MGDVLAFPGGPKKLSLRESALLKPPCAFCGVALSANGDEYACQRCGARMHNECYWGRVVPLDDWIAYMRRVMETDDDFEPPTVICAACR